jgi:hypothetical protein
MTAMGRPTVLTVFAVLEYPSPTITDLTTVPVIPPLSVANLTYAWQDSALESSYLNPDFPTIEEVTR